LKDKLGLGDELQVKWLPGCIRGEVRGSTIFVYDEGLEEAREALRHEFIEWALNQRAP
jgi:hypothetical protein